MVHQGPTGENVGLAPDIQGMTRCWSRHPFATRPAGADGVPDRCPKQHKHQGPTGADVVPARWSHQQKAKVDVGPGIREHQGLVSADGLQDRYP